MTLPIVVFDLETRPNPALLDDTGYWERLSEKLEPPANYRDPLKIAEWRSSALEKARASMALVPHQGVIRVIGARLLQDALEPTLLSVENEATLLESFAVWLKTVTSGGPFILAGWAIKRFDIPFLAGRCISRSISMPRHFPTPRNYARVVDAKEILDGSLSDWMRCMDMPPKDIEGPAILECSTDELVKHCRDDVLATCKLLDRLDSVFPSLFGAEA